MRVSEAVESRRSVRAFTDEPVDREVLARVLERAQRSPSGGNLQPWRAYVLGEATLASLRSLVRDRLAGGSAAPEPEYPIYPSSLWEPYRSRRFANGEQLYAAARDPAGGQAGPAGAVRPQLGLLRGAGRAAALRRPRHEPPAVGRPRHLAADRHAAAA